MFLDNRNKMEKDDSDVDLCEYYILDSIEGSRKVILNIELRF